MSLWQNQIVFEGNRGLVVRCGTRAKERTVESRVATSGGSSTWIHDCERSFISSQLPMPTQQHHRIMTKLTSLLLLSVIYLVSGVAGNECEGSCIVHVPACSIHVLLPSSTVILTCVVPNPPVLCISSLSRPVRSLHQSHE
jgi:hypothetical protein